jgi:hypothetical protein
VLEAEVLWSGLEFLMMVALSSKLFPCNGYSRHIKVVCNGLVSHFSLNHTHRSLTVILEEPWHRRSCENSNFQNGSLFTFVEPKDRETGLGL